MSRKIRYIRLVDNADEVIDFLLLVILCGGIEGAKAPNGKMIDNDDINFLPPIAASDLLGKLNPDPDFLKNFYLDPQAKSKVFGKYPGEAAELAHFNREQKITNGFESQLEDFLEGEG